MRNRIGFMVLVSLAILGIQQGGRWVSPARRGGLVAVVDAADFPSNVPQPRRVAHGMDRRVPWTTSRLTGTPEAPPPYRTERVLPLLKFERPVAMERLPGTQRLVVVELGGRIYSFVDSPDTSKADLLLDLAAHATGFFRAYGIAFHPQFEKNREVFVCYVLPGGNPRGSRVSRFKMAAGDPPVVDPRSETILLEWPSGGHNGGCLRFGPDGYLYVSTGDGSNPSPPDSLDSGQDISDLLASILRIDVDHPPSGKTYGVPADNPFIQHPGARPEVWAYGLRNPWKMAFDQTGALWVGDVGWEMWEMIYRVERGGNYGWSVKEGQQPVRPEARRGPTPIIAPTIEHGHTESRSITGGRVYCGPRFKELAGAYIYGDYVTGKLWGLRHDGRQVTWRQELADSPLEIIDFGEAVDGELYILDYGGTISRLVSNPAAQANQAFPRRLSETGLFASTRDHTPAAGVIPYGINAEPWADHAAAERFLAVPGSGTLGVYDKQNLQVGHVKGAWIFPDDTVFARTLFLDLQTGNPASRRRLETQILHQDHGTWRAYTYIWNDDQADAALAEAEGRETTFTVQDAREAGGSRKQPWRFASRTECLVCHTTRAGSILGFNPAQLNRDFVYGAGLADQLGTLNHLRLFEQPLPDPLPRLPSPADPQEDLDRRARAYLHANCAACHRRGGGGTAAFELLYDLSLDKTLLVGSRPSQGTFDIHSPENVAADDPYRSVLYYRMAKLGPGRMPHAGSGIVDERGLDLIHDWIQQLQPPAAQAGRGPSVTDEQRSALQTLRSPTTAEPARQEAIGSLLSSTSGALYLLRALDTQQLPDAARQQVLLIAPRHPAAPVRELFERFVPPEQRIQRLGNVIKPEAILAQRGDPERGRQFFLKGAASQCRNCHRLGSDGQEVGPDLTRIGQKYDRSQLLESILEPSKRIDPAFVTYLVETTRGAVFSGLLVKKSDREVILKDAQGKLVTVPAADVETLVPQQKSLMPDLLLRDLTLQEVADLVDFLASLK